MNLGAIGGVTDDDSVVSQGDSHDLRAYIYDEDRLPIVADDVSSVQFTVQNPKGAKTDFDGTVEEDGAGFLRFVDTDVLGKWLWVARFTLAGGQIKSRRGQFAVTDPFEQIIPDDYMAVADAVWMRFEDCFDADEGGPMLRDLTLQYFDKTKIPRFVNQGLLMINYTNPITALQADYFWTPSDPNATEITIDYTHDPDSYILVQATFLAVVRHLMASYVEQPDLIGGNVVRETRRDYLQRWGTIYQIEDAAFKIQLGLWKRQFLNFGHTKMLVSSKQGRLAGQHTRTRNVGRGGFGY